MTNDDSPALDADRILAALTRHGVDLVIVGGVAATAHGAVRPTADLDCLTSRTDSNLDRLAAAMSQLNTRHSAELLDPSIRRRGSGLLGLVDGMGDLVSILALGILFTVTDPAWGFIYGAVISIAAVAVLAAERVGATT